MNNKYLKKYGWPQHPSKYLLKRIYGSVPPADDFMISGMDVDELERFVYPFRVDPRDLKTKFGRDLDIPLDHCFEMQLHDFIEKIYKTNNEPDYKIRFTKMFLRRMGRFGFLYRHGFNPKSPSKIRAERLKRMKQLESEIKRAKRRLKKRRQFEEERIIQRQEVRKIFDSLNEKDQNHLLQEYDHAKVDPRIIAVGGELEDFLIIQFKLKISLYEEMRSVHKIKTKLKEIILDLERIIYQNKNKKIDSSGIINTNLKNELTAIDFELKNLEAAY